MRKTEQKAALDVRYSELKRALKEIKRTRQQLEVAPAEDREDGARAGLHSEQRSRNLLL